MKIDICINFNNLTPPAFTGMMPGQKPPYYQQLLYLVKSIKLNWDKNIYDYSIYVHHSRALDEDKQNELRSMGCEVIHNPRETQIYFNRENVLAYPTDGDYTLILDTDILVLKTPSLDLSKETCARREGHTSAVMTLALWAGYYDRLGMKFYDQEGYHFNGGVWLIKNTIKPMMHWYFIKYVGLLEELHTKNRHLSVQWYWSMLIKKFNWGLLDRNINVFTREWPNNRDAEVIHYLGMLGMNDEIVSAFKNIEERYAAL